MSKEYEKLRGHMVQEQIIARGIKDKNVIQAMLQVPRHMFVLSDALDEAYEDYPLSIGFGQTISQPYIVALMTELIDPKPEHKILEIGTGSGYQAAVLSRIVKDVYTVERIGELCSHSRKILESLGYRNVHYKCGNGYEGWEEFAPYDGIVVTAAPDKVPGALIGQLKVGGRLVIPVGDGFMQSLKLITKDSEDQIREEDITGVRFVRLVND